MKLLTPKQYEHRVIFALIAIPVSIIIEIAIIVKGFIGVFS